VAHHSAELVTMIGPDATRHVRLRDGTAVCLRAARGDDRQRVIDFFNNLERQTIYTRFFSYRKHLSDSELEQMAHNDFVLRTIVLATVGSGDTETMIGGGSYVVDAKSGNPPTRAEMAFTVEEDYQGKGLASELLQSLIAIARSHGLRELTAEVLAHNASMLGVFRHCGLPARQRREGEVVQLTFDLGAG
jgi:RimJ/RimL family protein N-acetyltransferase